ncbi:MAG: DUF4369 domain-containing protein [Bacteroidales bacterium]|nr:DUF4369 domain-containing protein [Bacteroidales bacterium]
MKKLFLYAALAGMLLTACGKKEPEFVVKGSTTIERLNGHRVFLVPYGSKQIEDSIGVDSTVVEDGKFEFRGRGEYLARVTMDRKVRYGTQDLLIVTEPGGDIVITIDSLSTGGGTPQNEALQRWKDMKHAHDVMLAPQRAHLQYLRQHGDSVYAAALQDSIKAYNDDFREQVLGIARILGKGPAYDLLMQFYGPRE